MEIDGKPGCCADGEPAEALRRRPVWKDLGDAEPDMSGNSRIWLLYKARTEWRRRRAAMARGFWNPPKVRRFA